jgi:hypothetical protein
MQTDATGAMDGEFAAGSVRRSRSVLPAAPVGLDLQQSERPRPPRQLEAFRGHNVTSSDGFKASDSSVSSLRTPFLLRRSRKTKTSREANQNGRRHLTIPA